VIRTPYPRALLVGGPHNGLALKWKGCTAILTADSLYEMAGKSGDDLIFVFRR